MIVVDASVLATALVDDGADGDTVRNRLSGEDLVAPELVGPRRRDSDARSRSFVDPPIPNVRGG